VTLSDVIPRRGAAAFAEKVGVSPMTIRKIIKGYKPAFSTALKIYLACNGLVTFKDMGFSDAEVAQNVRFMQAMGQEVPEGLQNVTLEQTA
jgi:predicted transcriptional regulator